MGPRSTERRWPQFLIECGKLLVPPVRLARGAMGPNRKRWVRQGCTRRPVRDQNVTGAVRCAAEGRSERCGSRRTSANSTSTACGRGSVTSKDEVRCYLTSDAHPRDASRGRSKNTIRINATRRCESFTTSFEYSTSVVAAAAQDAWPELGRFSSCRCHMLPSIALKAGIS